jgi:hypothetical protein
LDNSYIDATFPALDGHRSMYWVYRSLNEDEEAVRLEGVFADEASRNSRLAGVNFWTTPDSGGPGIDATFPFSIEDFYPPPSP